MGNTYEFVNADGSGDFGSSSNWIDETSPTTPGPPGSADTALVGTAGKISGTGNVGTLVLDGTAGVLSSTGQKMTAMTLEFEGRVALKAESFYTVDGRVEQVGTSTVMMSGGSDLYVSPGSSPGTSVFDVAASSGDTATFRLSGLGTVVELAAGNALIGDAGIGAMTISSGAELKTDDEGDTYGVGGRVIIGGTAGGVGSLTVTGPSSTVQAAGEIEVDQGSLSILAGAEASALGINVDAATGAGTSVLVSGSGSRLTAGNAVVGGGSNASSMVIANAASVELASLQVGAGGGAGTSTVSVKGAGSTLEIRGPLDLGGYEVGPGGRFSGNSGSLNITSGAKVVQDGGSKDVLGSTGPESGSILVSGIGSTFNTGTTSLIVGDDATGTVTIGSGGDIITSAASGPAVTIGHYANGSVTIVGTGSNWAARGEFDVGYYGVGTVLVDAGASLETGHANGIAGLVIGNQAGSSGNVTVTGFGSTLTNSGAFVVGMNGSGTIAISSGAVVQTSVPSGSSTDGAILGEFASASGTAEVTGAGSLWMIRSDLIIGDAGTGALTIGAGAIVAAGSLVVAETGTGSLTVSGAGSMIAIAGSAQFGNSGSAVVTVAQGGAMLIGGAAELKDGHILLNGGTLGVGRTLTLDAGQSLGGHGTVAAFSTINAATVQASGGTLSFIGGVTGTGKLEIEAASTLSLTGQVGSGQETIFESSNSKLVLGTPASFAGTIGDFIKGDTIDLSHVAAGSLTYNGQTLTLNETDGASLMLKFSGCYAQSSFGMTSDGHGGTFIIHT